MGRTRTRRSTLVRVFFLPATRPRDGRRRADRLWDMSDARLSWAGVWNVESSFAANLRAESESTSCRGSRHASVVTRADGLLDGAARIKDEVIFQLAGII